MFIAQGTADQVVYPPASKTTADLLHAAGTDTRFAFYRGADHDTTLQAALPDLLNWAADRFGAPDHDQYRETRTWQRNCENPPGCRSSPRRT